MKSKKIPLMSEKITDLEMEIVLLKKKIAELEFRDCSKETLDRLIEKYPSGLISLKIFRRELYGK